MFSNGAADSPRSVATDALMKWDTSLSPIKVPGRKQNLSDKSIQAKLLAGILNEIKVPSEELYRLPGIHGHCHIARIAIYLVNFLHSPRWV